MSNPRTREILHLSLPIIGGMMSQNLLNLVDTWLVGGLGAAALAACGLANFLNFMSVAAITGLSTAVQAMAARRVGEGKSAEAAVPLNGGLLLSLAVGAPLSLLLIVLAPWFFPAMVNDPAVAARGGRAGRHELLVPRLLERGQAHAAVPLHAGVDACAEHRVQLDADLR